MEGDINYTMIAPSSNASTPQELRLLLIRAPEQYLLVITDDPTFTKTRLFVRPAL